MNHLLIFTMRLFSGIKSPPLWGGWVGLLLFSSCSNELDLLDDWKETTVVYGLLNQSDTAGGKLQYIKIYKAYLGEGNALQMAQNYDSINYGDQLTVQMERWLYGNKVETYTLQQDNSIAKDPGIFAAPDQVVYTTDVLLDENSEYQLVITNASTGNIVRARTNLVKKFIISSPSSGGTAAFSNPAGKQKVQWISAVNGLLYQLVIRFHYDEKNISSGATTSKYADWVFPIKRATSTVGGQPMDVAFQNDDFYKFIKAAIPPDDNVQRFARNKKLEYIFSVAAEEYATYMEVYTPSNTIVQEKPEYTNIENGLGLFSSRYNVIITRDSLNKASVDSLITGQYTSNLGFN